MKYVLDRNPFRAKREEEEEEEEEKKGGEGEEKKKKGEEKEKSFISIDQKLRVKYIRTLCRCMAEWRHAPLILNLVTCWGRGVSLATSTYFALLFSAKC
jgi:hypothetical protein